MKKTAFIVILILSLNITFQSFSASAPMRLNVPTFVQHFEPWKDQKYGFGNRTIEYAGCALTSLSMLLKFYGVDTNPADLNQWLKNNGGFAGSESISWSKAAQYGSSIQYIGMFNYTGDANLQQIKNEIDNGYPVIAKMSYQGTYHYVLICGYNDNTFYINDPWTEDSSKTINEGYEPYNNPARSIKGIVVLRSAKATPPKVPVVKVAVSKFEKPVYDNFLPDIKFKDIELVVGDPKMKVGSEEMNIDDAATAPVIINGRTYLPVRAVVEAMGGEVKWENAARKIEIIIGKRTIEMWVDKRQAFINGFPFPLDTQPLIINSKTLLPIRPIIEKLNCKIEWNPDEKKVTIRE
ncbi:MAG TPA: stalk domain-containing protein [Clostridia bacterium]